MKVNEKSLKGRPIGLKANMSKEEIKNHLLRIQKEWQEEGFTEDEVNNAIISKCRPLVYGFYWHRFPNASLTLEKVLDEMGLEIERSIQDSMKKLNRSLKQYQPKSNPKEKIKKFMTNYLEQF